MHLVKGKVHINKHARASTNKKFYIRILTDGQLRVLDKDTKLPYPNIYALGDCATIEGNDLPATAQGKEKKTSLNKLNLTFSFSRLTKSKLSSQR